MSTILMVLGVAFFLMIACLVFLVFPYILLLRMNTCKYCGHIMEYKGLKEDNDKGHYLFHCPHCGAWQQIPEEELFGKNENADFTNAYKSNL